MSGKGSPYYSVPTLDGKDLALVVGSDLVLAFSTDQDHGNRDARVNAFDSDGNLLSCLMTVPTGLGIGGMTAADMLALCVPTAERLYPNHLRTEQG